GGKPRFSRTRERSFRFLPIRYLRTDLVPSVVPRRCERLLGEEIVIVEAAIESAGYLRRLRAERRTSAFQKNDHNYASVIRICVASEPALACACVRAGSGLTENFGFVEVS